MIDKAHLRDKQVVFRLLNAEEEIVRSDFRAGRAEGRALWHWTCAQMIAYLHEHPARRFTTVMGGALRSGGGTICRIDPAVVRFQANRKCFNTPMC